MAAEKKIAPADLPTSGVPSRSQERRLQAQPDPNGLSSGMRVRAFNPVFPQGCPDCDVLRKRVEDLEAIVAKDAARRAKEVQRVRAYRQKAK